MAKGLPNSQKEIYDESKGSKNRAHHIRRDTDTVTDFKVGFEQHVEAIMHYFKNVIKPNIIENGESVDVPIIYGAQEIWKSVQADGYYRSKEGQIMTPLIMFKRTGVEPNTEMPKKLDANNPQIALTFAKQYSEYNKYDKFSSLNNMIPTKEYYNIVMPDYVKISYDCIVWTDYIEDMDRIIETINYARDSYWGIPNKFNFLTRMGSFSDTIEVSDGQDRVLKVNFDIVANGYIIPENIQKTINNMSTKVFSKSTITFTESTGSFLLF